MVLILSAEGKGSSYIGEASFFKESELNEILSVLGREDLKFLNELRRKRRNTGILVSAIGAGIIIGSLYYLYMYPNATQSFFWVFFGWILAMSIIREGINMISDASKTVSPGAGRYRVYTAIECLKCHYKEVKSYEMGEFVGKIVDKKCPKCGGDMRVAMIFSEPEKKIKTVGMPILPGMGGASSSVWGKISTIMFRLLPPLGIVYRYYSKRRSRSSK